MLRRRASIAAHQGQHTPYHIYRAQHNKITNIQSMHVPTQLTYSVYNSHVLMLIVL